jgi:hypothetical protein
MSELFRLKKRRGKHREYDSRVCVVCGHDDLDHFTQRWPDRIGICCNANLETTRESDWCTLFPNERRGE